MDIQQSINLAIVQRFEAERIRFADPTQSLFIEQANGKDGISRPQTLPDRG